MTELDAVNFDVAISKTLESARRRFTLSLRFQTRAKRSLLYGPSGAGKTLTLRALAGLLRPDRGSIKFQSEALFDSTRALHVPARNRRFGFLFQDYALFPHLNVRQNIGFGLTGGAFNPSLKQREPRVERWLDRLELGEVAAQMPSELSGGQAQRVALARALVNQPRALLLDEPFSALDPALRERMRSEVDQLLSELDIPVLMITHDPQDLQWFGDEVIHLNDGVVDARAVAAAGAGAAEETWPPARA